MTRNQFLIRWLLITFSLNVLFWIPSYWFHKIQAYSVSFGLLSFLWMIVLVVGTLGMDDKK